MPRDEEILSPPYPGEGTTTRRLHEHLIELASWARARRLEFGIDEIPEVKQPPPLAAYQVTPVPSQFRTLMFLRKLRESWDVIVRGHELDWGTQQCLRKQAIIVAAAVQHLNSALMSFELQEARSSSNLEFFQKTMEAMYESLSATWEPSCEPETASTEEF